MCILIVKPAGANIPPLQLMSRYAKRNPHGFGYATADKVYKTLSFAKFINEIAREDERQPMLIHFRYATHGSTVQENCHPFKDEQTGVAFAHNGILPITPMGDMTDSETAFRGLFLPHIEKSGIHSKALADEVYNILGASKVAFINKRGQIKKFGNFIEIDGVYYSNLNYLQYR